MLFVYFVSMIFLDSWGFIWAHLGPIWLCKSQGEKKTFYRALYRYKMNVYKGTRVPPFYSGNFWGVVYMMFETLIITLEFHVVLAKEQ